MSMTMRSVCAFSPDCLRSSEKAAVGFHGADGVGAGGADADFENVEMLIMMCFPSMLAVCVAGCGCCLFVGWFDVSRGLRLVFMRLKVCVF